MCDPVVMVASSVMKAGGIYQKGQAEKRKEFAAARESEYQAALALDDAQAQAANIRRAGDAQRGETLADIAASGVKIGEGSAWDAEKQVVEQAARDEYMTILTGDRQAAAYRRDAANKRAAGRDAARAGVIGATGSLLSAGYEYSKAKGWKGWDWGGYNGTNDRGRFSFGSNQDWWLRNGRGGD